MLRMFRIDMGILGSYLCQVVPIALFVGIVVSVGADSVVPAGVMFSVMSVMLVSLSANAYDEQQGWGAFRLALPLSRRDAVVGRYLVAGIIGFAGTVLGALTVQLAAAVCGVVPAFSGVWASGDARYVGTLAAFIAFAVASIVPVVSLPVMFRWGHAKAIQWLPIICVFLVSLVPFASVALSTGLGVDVAAAFNAFLTENGDLFLAMAEHPALTVAVVALASLAVAAALLAVSCLVALRLYRRRDL